jgi:hypothetical protein
VYKLDSVVGFIGNEQVQAQECYVGIVVAILGSSIGALSYTIVQAVGRQNEPPL